MEGLVADEEIHVDLAEAILKTLYKEESSACPFARRANIFLQP